jgi:cytochrome P450
MGADRQRATTAEPCTLPIDRRRPFDPPDELARFREEQPVRRLTYPDGHLGWLVTSHHLARTVLSDPRFSSRMELNRFPVRRAAQDSFVGKPAPPGMFTRMDPPDHTRCRRLLAKHFTRARVHGLEPYIRQVISEQIDVMRRTGPPVDLVETFAEPVPARVMCTLLGIPEGEHPAFQRAARTLNSLESSAVEGEAASELITDRLGALIEQKRAQADDELLSSLVARGELTEEELVGIGWLLISAGHDTTANMLGLGALVLIGSHQVSRLRDIRSWDLLVEELLRYLTIFQFGITRTPTEDVELGGEQLAAGECVTVSLSAANRDPQRFADPDRLDLDRPASGHLAFGYGIHQCLGQHLARLEMRLGFEQLFTRLPGLRLGRPIDELTFRTDHGIYGVNGLPVGWS